MAGETRLLRARSSEGGNRLRVLRLTRRRLLYDRHQGHAVRGLARRRRATGQRRHLPGPGVQCLFRVLTLGRCGDQDRLESKASPEILAISVAIHIIDAQEVNPVALEELEKPGNDPPAQSNSFDALLSFDLRCAGAYRNCDLGNVRADAGLSCAWTRYGDSCITMLSFSPASSHS